MSEKCLICPLLTALTNAFTECKKEKCAWFDIASNRCSILLLSERLRGLRYR